MRSPHGGDNGLYWWQCILIYGTFLPTIAEGTVNQPLTYMIFLHYACWYLPTSCCLSLLQEVSSADRVCVWGQDLKYYCVEFPLFPKGEEFQISAHFRQKQGWRRMYRNFTWSYSNQRLVGIMKYFTDSAVWLKCPVMTAQTTVSARSCWEQKPFWSHLIMGQKQLSWVLHVGV